LGALSPFGDRGELSFAGSTKRRLTASYTMPGGNSSGFGVHQAFDTLSIQASLARAPADIAGTASLLSSPTVPLSRPSGSRSCHWRLRRRRV
jgi:hypothetical protein